MMKKKTVFKLKEPQEGAPESFDTRESAFAYISQKYGSELVKTYEQVRLRGEYVAKLPFGRIRKNIEEACKKQKKFPIVTANNLRGRLRRTGFTIYKRGSKGFAYVSVIKRKFILRERASRKFRKRFSILYRQIPQSARRTFRTNTSASMFRNRRLKQRALHSRTQKEPKLWIRKSLPNPRSFPKKRRRSYPRCGASSCGWSPKVM